MLVDHSRLVSVVDRRSQDAAVHSDLVLYDPSGPARGGEAGLSDVVRTASARVVVFSWVAESDAVDRALALGAAGYLFKGLSAADLLASVLAIHGGDVVACRGHTGVGTPVPGTGEFASRTGLTARESEVLLLIVDGLTNAEIAACRSLSINTVKTYIRNAYSKIGVSSRSQAVRWGLEQGCSSSDGPAREGPRPHPFTVTAHGP
ncbi:helix-turn-helix transcriptional regulator [Nocardioides sp. PD653]|uniref:helix-turn-helix transcriptional regulator n=2 Tax=unclassified Nocardioides TaxID=2615069 RepID=UPI0013FDD3B8|nr:response regulator transcription factor [Nocardioides sp. PD653]